MTLLRFLQDKNCDEYKYFLWKVISLSKRPVKGEVADADREDEGGGSYYCLPFLIYQYLHVWVWV